MSTQLEDYIRGFRRAPIAPSRMIALYGKPLVYLVGAQNAFSHPGCVVEAPAGQDVSGEGQFKIAYATMFGPQGRLDGKEWMTNLCAQFTAAKSLGFQFVELDRIASYPPEDALKACGIAADYRLGVIAKNLYQKANFPDAALAIASHPNVWGFIVERGTGTPSGMDAMRERANKAGIAPVWFVFNGTSGANQCADQIRHGKFRGMGVSYSSADYKDSTALLTPTP